MKKSELFHKMQRLERRSFLRNLSLLLASPVVPNSVLTGTLAMLGKDAGGQEGDVLFLEVNFRDQWDFGHAFVSPSIAKAYSQLPKDGDDGVALFSAPELVGNHYLTPDSMELKDHLDTVAVIDTCELVIGGIHGHEASNATRSPGRSTQDGAGRKDMATVDKRPGGRVGGNEVHYSSTPTPAVLHNYLSKTRNPAITNGVILRSSIRSNIHTFYHFEAELANAQPDRFFTRESFLNFFKGQELPREGVLDLHKAEVLAILEKVDRSFAKELKLATREAQNHFDALDLIAGRKPVDFSQLDLTVEEKAYWTDGIPGQFVCADDRADQCSPVDGTMNIGEMFGYADKLFKSGQIKTVAIDFDFNDIHTARTESVLRTQGTQTAAPLARLISSLKAAGLYDRTLIAMYTLDGSRSPKRNSRGYDSKNSVVLAGGMIKGGYYGDLKLEGNKVSYHRPDDSGQAVSSGTTGRDKRVAGADIYRTVAKAMGASEETLGQFPDLQSGKLLSYLLR
jgi:hypothetical protein